MRLDGKGAFMYPYWDTIIAPILSSLRPRVLVEVGCEQGLTTGRLLNYCRQNDAILHGIDPAPRFDVEDWARRTENRLIFHTGGQSRRPAGDRRV